MEYVNSVGEMFRFFGINLVLSLIIFFVGRWVAKIITGFIKNMMTRSKVDETLISFLSRLIYFTLITFIAIAALNQLGIQTTSFIVVLGAAGLAVGLALQGSLSNFAAGVLLILFRPFKVGDSIEAAGTAGIVEEIKIFTTHLRSPDNKAIIIPNSKITADKIINISTKPTRRIDMIFGVSYKDNLDQVKAVITEVLGQDERILKDPPPVIGVIQLADSSVNFAVRPWVKAADYWNVHCDLNERIKKRFDEENITIPFPQQDVYLYKNEG